MKRKSEHTVVVPYLKKHRLQRVKRGLCYIFNLSSNDIFEIIKNLSSSELLNLMMTCKDLLLKISKLIEQNSKTIVFLLDTTRSMSGYFSFLKKLVENRRFFDGRCFNRFALVSYKDHDAEESKIAELTVPFIDASIYHKELIKINSNHLFEGGQDDAEAVADGLNFAINLLIEQKSRVKHIVIVCDAPGHGFEKSSEMFSDNYTKCPCDLDVYELLEKSKNNGIKTHCLGFFKAKLMINKISNYLESHYYFSNLDELDDDNDIKYAFFDK